VNTSGTSSLSVRREKKETSECKRNVQVNQLVHPVTTHEMILRSKWPHDPGHAADWSGVPKPVAALIINGRPFQTFRRRELSVLHFKPNLLKPRPSKYCVMVRKPAVGRARRIKQIFEFSSYTKVRHVVRVSGRVFVVGREITVDHGIQLPPWMVQRTNAEILNRVHESLSVVLRQ